MHSLNWSIETILQKIENRLCKELQIHLQQSPVKLLLQIGDILYHVVWEEFCAYNRTSSFALYAMINFVLHDLKLDSCNIFFLE